MTARAGTHRIPIAELKRLHLHRRLPNLKIPLFYALLVAAGAGAWATSSELLRWVLYAIMGYLWMGIVTFMHDCTHNTLFEKRWKNWAFGVFSMIPLLVTFVSFKDDHLAHHRYNRSPRDPDAFTMGRRGLLDFVLFYAYILIGGFLTVVQFTFIYPFQHFDRRRWLIHGAELLLRVVVIGGLLALAAGHDVLGRVLAIWLIPAFLFTLLNSVRFIAEHYDTPWDEGQLLGTRTILSNPANRFFWNNINYHIGHHVHPGVPWYNLKKLHLALRPELAASGAIVDASYLAVFLGACVRGPESVEGNARQQAARVRSNVDVVSETAPSLLRSSATATAATAVSAATDSMPM